MWLFTTFEARFPKPVLVRGEAGRPIVIETTLDNWCAEVVMTPNTRLGRLKQADGHWYYMSSQAEITISRNEELMLEEDELAPLFQGDYRHTAADITHRLALFLRFKSKMTFLKAVEAYEAEMASETQCALVDLTPVEPIVPDWMVDYLYDQYDPKLCEQLLEVAQTSIDNQRSRRAALELAMACEAALGLRVYSSAFARVSLGERFSEQYPEQARHIIELFEHKEFLTRKGLGLFNFSPAAKRQAWLQQLNEQKEAVACLMSWLVGEDIDLAV